MSMVVLLTGASGFIGRHLAAALLKNGHEIVCASRHSPTGQLAGCRHVEADFTRDFDVETWLPRLERVDIVINAVGIIAERGAQTFDAIHDRTPRAMFAACVAAGVGLVIQVSALGADQDARSGYHRSKKSADDFLLALPIDSVIVQPSLVFGKNGTSARLFAQLASLPLIPLPGRGDQMVQPIHIDDLVEGIVALLTAITWRRVRIPLVGPFPLSFKEMLSTFRRSMKMTPARFIPVPRGVVRAAARLGDWIPCMLLRRETLEMLERGNTGDPAMTTALLGRASRPVEQFIPSQDASDIALRAKLGWLLPLLRISIALVWIWTAFVSAGLYPVDASYALLERTGIPETLAPLMLYGAASLDLLLGIAILIMPRRRVVWLVQLGLILCYSVIITWKLPEFWLHPYGPLTKNLPMLAAIWLILELQDKT